jgi:hypothetical protein
MRRWVADHGRPRFIKHAIRQEQVIEKPRWNFENVLRHTSVLYIKS